MGKAGDGWRWNKLFSSLEQVATASSPLPPPRKKSFPSFLLSISSEFSLSVLRPTNGTKNIRVPCLSLFRLVPKPMPSRRSQRYISAISPFSLAPFIHLRGSLFHAGFLLKAVRNVCGERERGKKPVIYPVIRKDGEDLAFHSRESGNNNLGTL